MQTAIDISSEMAEGFVLQPFGIPFEDVKAIKVASTGEGFHYRHLIPRFDEEVLPFITSVSLCCGLHSGDPVMLRQVAAIAISRGIHIGAHPSYPGVFSFGQRRLELSDDDLEAVLLFQFGATSAVVRGLGGRLRHVKCHGPLSSDISYDQRTCRVMVNAIKKFDPELVMVLNANSPGLDFARGEGLRVAGEGYVDRGYDVSGRLVPRDHPQALLDDAGKVAQRVTEMVCKGQVTCVDGSTMALHADTICLHSDTPGAARFGAAVVAALKKEMVAIKPLADVLG